MNYNPITTDVDCSTNKKHQLFEIVEQPNENVHLFINTKNNDEIIGAIFGQNYSTEDNLTFINLKVIGYTGPVIIIISCVSNDEPFSPHPHKLIGPLCKEGICTLVDVESNGFQSIPITNLYVKYVDKIEEIKDSIKKRENLSIDPFSTGFNCIVDPKAIDLMKFRLAIQMVIPSSNGTFSKVLTPKYTNTIHFHSIRSPRIQTKMMVDDTQLKLKKLQIHHLSCTNSVVSGGQKIMLFCSGLSSKRIDRVDGDYDCDRVYDVYDVCVRFYENHSMCDNGKDDVCCWESFVRIDHKNVYRKYGISFTVPPYKNLTTSKVKHVFLQLFRRCDGAVSESIPFEYLPCDLTIIQLKRKKVNENAHIMFNEVYAHMLLEQR